MFTIDKIKYHVHETIIDTMNHLVNLQKIDILNQWLKSCSEEIERRTKNNEDIYPLQYEKQYLEMLLK